MSVINKNEIKDKNNKWGGIIKSSHLSVMLGSRFLKADWPIRGPLLVNRMCVCRSQKMLTDVDTWLVKTKGVRDLEIQLAPRRSLSPPSPPSRAIKKTISFHPCKPYTRTRCKMTL